jgi:hypothetical protein
MDPVSGPGLDHRQEIFQRGRALVDDDRRGHGLSHVFEPVEERMMDGLLNPLHAERLEGANGANRRFDGVAFGHVDFHRWLRSDCRADASKTFDVGLEIARQLDLDLLKPLLDSPSSRSGHFVRSHDADAVARTLDRNLISPATEQHTYRDLQQLSDQVVRSDIDAALCERFTEPRAIHAVPEAGQVEWIRAENRGRQHVTDRDGRADERVRVELVGGERFTNPADASVGLHTDQYAFERIERTDRLPMTSPVRNTNGRRRHRCDPYFVVPACGVHGV